QEQCHILGREPVIAALFKEEAVAGASAECVDLVAYAAFAHVTDPAGACGDGEGPNLDRWGSCGHRCFSSRGAGSCPPDGWDAWGRRDAVPLQERLSLASQWDHHAPRTLLRRAIVT